MRKKDRFDLTLKVIGSEFILTENLPKTTMCPSDDKLKVINELNSIEYHHKLVQ